MTIKAQKLEGVSRAGLATEFEEVYRPKLVAAQEGAGGARGGMPGGWIHGLSMYRIYHKDRDGIFVTDLPPLLESAMSELWKWEPGEAYIQTIMVNRLEPQGKLDYHVDGPPYFSRYHLPIISRGTFLWEDYVGTVTYPGSWYGPLAYWLPHSATNPHDVERIHYVVDFGPEVTP